MIRKSGLVVLAVGLVAQVATAQMSGGGGSHHGAQPSNPAGSPSRSMDAMSAMGAMRGSLIFGTDGVVYTLRRAAATTATQNPSIEVIAIRPGGAIGWTTKIEGGMGQLALSGNLVFVASGGGDMGMGGRGATVDDTARLVALSATSGVVQWQVDLDGFGAMLEPFPGGAYVVSMKRDTANMGSGMHNGSIGTGAMKRFVTAIDTAGKILWKLDLD